MKQLCIASRAASPASVRATRRGRTHPCSLSSLLPPLAASSVKHFSPPAAANTADERTGSTGDQARHCSILFSLHSASIRAPRRAAQPGPAAMPASRHAVVVVTLRHFLRAPGPRAAPPPPAAAGCGPPASPVPPSLPCPLGKADPAVVFAPPAPPPPDPPLPPAGPSYAPPRPPPVDVIELNTELLPTVAAAPPAPTVTV